MIYVFYVLEGFIACFDYLHIVSCQSNVTVGNIRGGCKYILLPSLLTFVD